MGITRLGSLNLLEQISRGGYMRSIMEEEMGSADTIGRIMSQINNDEIREINKEIYKKMKRNKAIKPMGGRKFVLIIDGHETTASYRRHCEGCLERKIETKDGEKT
jgi:predicted phosphoribosyltransferase